MSSHELKRGATDTVEMHGTPRPTRRNDPLSSSMEFTPAKDLQARTSSFKRLSGSATRSMKADLISSVLSKPLVKQPDFRIFVDIPSQLDANSTSHRGLSPATPKRSRSEVGDREGSFDGLSPIGSPKLCGFSPDFEPQSTPKRRKSSGNFLRSSMSDLFSQKREDGLCTGLSKSVDFSKLPSASTSGGFSTPKRRSKSDVTPAAPRKEMRRSVATDLQVPEGKRLDFDDSKNENTPSTNQQLDIPVDFAGAMGVVGFISSHLARGGERIVPLSQLVHLISSASVAHKTATSALMAVRNLAKAIPEWVSVEGDKYTFSTELRTFQVLQKLAERRRQQIMEDTSELRSSIAEMRKSLSKSLAH